MCFIHRASPLTKLFALRETGGRHALKERGRILVWEKQKEKDTSEICRRVKGVSGRERENGSDNEMQKA